MYLFFILMFLLGVQTLESMVEVQVYNKSKEPIIIYTYWKKDISLITDAKILNSGEITYIKVVSFYRLYIQKGTNIEDITKPTAKHIVKILHEFHKNVLIVEDNPLCQSGLSTKNITIKEFKKIYKIIDHTLPEDLPLQELLTIADSKEVKEEIKE